MNEFHDIPSYPIIMFIILLLIKTIKFPKNNKCTMTRRPSGSELRIEFGALFFAKLHPFAVEIPALSPPKTVK